MKTNENICKQKLVNECSYQHYSSHPKSGANCPSHAKQITFWPVPFLLQEPQAASLSEGSQNALCTGIYSYTTWHLTRGPISQRRRCRGRPWSWNPTVLSHTIWTQTSWPHKGWKWLTEGTAEMPAWMQFPAKMGPSIRMQLYALN